MNWRSDSELVTAVGLLAADVLAWALTAAVVYLARVLVLVEPHPVFWGLWMIAACWLLVRAAGGMYQPFGMPPAEELRRSVLSCAAAALIELVVVLALGDNVLWRTAGLIVWLIVPFAVYLARSTVRTTLIRQGRFGTPCVVIGAGELARLVIREIRAAPELGLVPVAAFSSSSQHSGDVGGVPILGEMEDAAESGFGASIRHAFVALGPADSTDERRSDVIGKLARCFPRLYVFNRYSSPVNLWVTPCPVGPYLALDVGQRRFSRRQRVVKRAFDIVVTGTLLLVSSPLIAVGAVMVKCASPGPVFFKQNREGLNGETICVRKFRTMVVGAEKKLAEYLASDPAARFEYERTLKLRNDPRVIPKVGSFLRKSSIDELPQLWNILIGDMSLVGPRVMPKAEVDRYSVHGRDLRRDVPPGLTGFWQISYRNNSDLKIREIADSYYVQNWSVWLDMWILLRTFSVVLSGAGAY